MHAYSLLHMTTNYCLCLVHKIDSKYNVNSIIWFIWPCTDLSSLIFGSVRCLYQLWIQLSYNMSRFIYALFTKLMYGKVAQWLKFWAVNHDIMGSNTAETVYNFHLIFTYFLFNHLCCRFICILSIVVFIYSKS